VSKSISESKFSHLQLVGTDVEFDGFEINFEEPKLGLLIFLDSDFQRQTSCVPN